MPQVDLSVGTLGRLPFQEGEGSGRVGPTRTGTGLAGSDGQVVALPRSLKPEPRLYSQPMADRRTQPCPCGSGKKYRDCHWKADQAARNSPMPGPHDPANQLRYAVDVMLKLGPDRELFPTLDYDAAFLRLVRDRAHEVKLAEERGPFLSDCHAELDAKGPHPGRTMTHNTLLTLLIAGNLEDIARRGVSPEEAGAVFRANAEAEKARERLGR